MLVELAEGRKKEPLAPDGWVSIVDAMAAWMNTIDEQDFSVLPTKYREDKPIPSTFPDLYVLDPDPPLHLRGKISQISPERKAKVRRVARNAAAYIAGACEAGRVRSATRHARVGGPLCELPAYKWGLDDPFPRIWACQMDPKYPFALNVGHWIFLHQGDLGAEIDRWRKQWGLETVWTLPEPEETKEEAEMSGDTEPKNKGGRPPDAEKWANLLAVAVAYNHHIGWPEGTTGQVYKALEDYADRIGISILGKTQAMAAIGKARVFMDAKVSDKGQPLHDADGNTIE